MIIKFFEVFCLGFKICKGMDYRWDILRDRQISGSFLGEWLSSLDVKFSPGPLFVPSKEHCKSINCTLYFDEIGGFLYHLYKFSK